MTEFKSDLNLRTASCRVDLLKAALAFTLHYNYAERITHTIAKQSYVGVFK